MQHFRVCQALALHLLAGAVAKLALPDSCHVQHQVRPKILPQRRRRMKGHLRGTPQPQLSSTNASQAP